MQHSLYCFNQVVEMWINAAKQQQQKQTKIINHK
jgi:hypothetical protein